ncbi:hypothetical protein, partial [Stutzerimonas kunmingensis]|uniref:hypothetical protein n=1 Tax=Stutzerimonas kunmingensis TaxID=1211807 RepID=UPI00241F3658
LSQTPDRRKLVGGLLLGQRKAQGAKAVLELPVVQLNCIILCSFRLPEAGSDQPRSPLQFSGSAVCR